MSTVILKHVVTETVVEIDCATWESWKLTPLKDAYQVVTGVAGCVPCGLAPEVVEEAVPEVEVVTEETPPVEDEPKARTRRQTPAPKDGEE